MIATKWWIVGVVFSAVVSFGAGMIVEARWSQQLLITNAERQKDEAIRALKESVKQMSDAAEKSASERAERERALSEQVNELLEKATKNATDQEVLPADLVDAIDRAGRLSNDRK